MRLFLIGLWVVVVASGCKREEELQAGALRVDLSYATFRPGCLTLKVVDAADPTRGATQELALGVLPERSRELTVAVYRQEGWSQELVLTATAYERICAEQDPRPVATQTRQVQVPEEGILPVEMTLRAEDLDDDRFVSMAQGGTDCDDDDPQVHPDATEDCDGVDDNCSGDESDAPGVNMYYTDEDRDGYGKPGTLVVSCFQPPDTATNDLDCDDSAGDIHPDQPEVLCNGLDENCDGVADDTFGVGEACSTELGCSGTFVCQGTSSAACVSSQTPGSWYVDEDGDGRAGTFAGLGCVPPVAGAVNTQSDCEDSSPFAFSGGVERCDRLDNDCNGQVDESGCGAVDWSPVAGTSAAMWNAVAAYAEGKAWVAGDGGALAHVENGAVSSYVGCDGNWVSAWARPSDGQVFLGSRTGMLATHARTGGSGCTFTNTGRNSSINGLVGFELGGSTVLFAVASDGRIYRWDNQGLVEEVQMGANLRDVHGTSPTNLLVVGVANGTSQPVAFRANPAGGPWIPEALPSTVPTGAFLRGVHMVHGGLAYAVGDQGVVLQRDNGQWSELPRLAPGGTAQDLQDVAAYGRTVVYAAASDKQVYRFNGTAWSPDYMGDWTPFAIDGVGPHDLWVAGSAGTVIRRGP